MVSLAPYSFHLGMVKNLTIHVGKWHLRPWKWRLDGRESHLCHKISEQRRKAHGMSLTTREVQETWSRPCCLGSMAQHGLPSPHLPSCLYLRRMPCAHHMWWGRNPTATRFFACVDSTSHYPSDKWMVLTIIFQQWEHSVNIKEKWNNSGNAVSV